MKILSLLLAFLASHYWPAAAQYRRYGWLLAARTGAGDNRPQWLPTAGLVTIAIVVGAAVTLAGVQLAGLFGLLLVGVAGVVYTLGPEPLDRDIRIASDPSEPDKQQVALERLLLTRASSGAEPDARRLAWRTLTIWFVVLSLLLLAGLLS